MRHSIAAAAGLLLVACGGQESGNKQGDGNQAKAAEAGGGSAATMRAGQWEMTTQVVSMNIPNMPQGMSPPTPPPTTVRSCLTQEQVAQPNADFLTGSGDNGGCRSENMSMTGGRIQGAVVCNAQGAEMRATLNGTFAAESYDLTQQVQTSGQGQSMQMEVRTSGRRVGDCPAG